MKALTSGVPSERSATRAAAREYQIVYKRYPENDNAPLAMLTRSRPRTGCISPLEPITGWPLPCILLINGRPYAR